MGSELNFIHQYVPGPSSEAARPYILLHGTGGDEHDLIPVARKIDPYGCFLSPRGKVQEGNRLRYFKRVRPGVFDLEDLSFRTDELAGFLNRASVEYGFRLDDAVAVGYSNGANMAASLLLRYPGMLAGAVLMRPVLPYPVENPPMMEGVHVLILSGEDDELIPLEQAIALVPVFEASGALVKHEVLPAGHSITEEDVERTRQWVASIRNKDEKS